MTLDMHQFMSINGVHLVLWLFSIEVGQPTSLQRHNAKSSKRVTAKDLKDSLKLVIIHESTIRKTLNRHDLHGRTP